MKFDVIVGNPPYQLSDGGHGRSALPIYNHFINQAKKLNPRFLTMIVPARWYSGGRGLDDFRREMLHDDRIREIHDLPDATDVFPGVKISGGVCYFKWDRDHRGNCKVVNYLNGSTIVRERPLLEPGAETFIRYNEAIPIFEKVRRWNEPSFKSLVSVCNPFGLPTDYRGKQRLFDDAVMLYQKGGIGYVARSEIKSNTEIIDTWKVFIPTLGSGSDRFPQPVLGRPFLGEPGSACWRVAGSACTRTYLYIGPFADMETSKNVMSYIRTRFFRFLVLLIKNTQQAARRVYSLVPMQDFSKAWTDEELYAKYGLTMKEMDFIEKMVRLMPADD